MVTPAAQVVALLSDWEHPPTIEEVEATDERFLSLITAALTEPLQTEACPPSTPSSSTIERSDPSPSRPSYPSPPPPVAASPPPSSPERPVSPTATTASPRTPPPPASSGKAPSTRSQPTASTSTGVQTSPSNCNASPRWSPGHYSSLRVTLTPYRVPPPTHPTPPPPTTPSCNS